MSGPIVGPVKSADGFVPCTREIDIGRGVVYRPLRSWHSGVLAGEGITSVGGDGSGCIKLDPKDDHYIAPRPQTVVHRLYWNKRTKKKVSAFLSYPRAMGACDEYFWEANIDDCMRWTGPKAEQRMEASILARIGDSMVKKPVKKRRRP
jgi:hypothetical protein